MDEDGRMRARERREWPRLLVVVPARNEEENLEALPAFTARFRLSELQHRRASMTARPMRRARSWSGCGAIIRAERHCSVLHIAELPTDDRVAGQDACHVDGRADEVRAKSCSSPTATSSFTRKRFPARSPVFEEERADHLVLFPTMLLEDLRRIHDDLAVPDAVHLRPSRVGGAPIRNRSSTSEWARSTWSGAAPMTRSAPIARCGSRCWMT